MMLTFVGYLLFLALPITGLLLFSCLFEYNNIGKVKITLTKVLGSIVDTLSILGIIITVIKYGGIYTYNDTVGKIISIGYKGISVEYNEQAAITDEFFSYETAWHNVSKEIAEIAERYRNGEDVKIDLSKAFFKNDVNLVEWETVNKATHKIEISTDNKKEQDIPFSETYDNGEEFDLYAADGGMSVQDYRKWRQLNSPSNFTITDPNLGAGGQKTKCASNIAAIKLLKQLETENRNATAEEQETLSKYVGWGGIPQAFDSNNDKWSAEYAQLKELLTDEEYAAAKGSTLNAHYTSPEVISAIYKALDNMGFKKGKVLEIKTRYLIQRYAA